jgi:hypothetical protein
MKKNISTTNTCLLVLIGIQIILLFYLFVFRIDTPFNHFVNSTTGLSTNGEILQAKVDLLEKHEGWIISILGLSFTITAIMFGLIQWYFSKKAEDNVFTNLAEIANNDKDAFREAVKMRSIELELMSKYPIYIVYDPMLKREMSDRLYKLLTSYHFNNIIKPITYNTALLEKFCKKTVIVFCEDSFNKTECEKLLKQNPKVGVLGFGQYNKENFSLPKHDCLNYANSFSSVYNNLMSLLHYKRYLLSER